MMSDEASRLIQLASKPLAHNPELQLAAIADLGRRITEWAPSDVTLSDAADALQAADLRPGRKRWIILGAAIAGLAALAVLTHSLIQLRTFAGSQYYVSSEESTAKLALDPTRHLTDRQRLILRGNLASGNRADAFRSLWQSDPDNPAYLLEYAKSYYKANGELNSEILEAAARIDPTNAWYPIISAAGLAKKAVKKSQPSYWAKNEKPSFTVLDEDKLQQALAILHQHAGKPKLSGGDPSILSERLAIVPERKDYVSQFPRELVMATQDCGIIELRFLADAAAVQAKRLAERGDADGFKQLLSDWKWLIETSAKDGHTMVDILVSRALFNSPLPEFAQAAKILNVEEADTLASMQARQDEFRKQKRKPFRSDDVGRLIDAKSSLMTGLSVAVGSSIVEKPIRISAEDLTPARYADHALAGRIHAAASIVLFGLLGGLALLVPQRNGPLASALSARLTDLLRPGDRWRLMAGGILLPILWYFLITRLTPLTAREWSMKPSGLLLPAVQLGSLTILMLISTSCIAAAQINRRAGFLGISPRFTKTGWFAMFASALAIPLAGALHALPGLGGTLFFVACGLSALASAWLLWGLACHLLGKPMQDALLRAMMARTVAPSWIAAVLAMSGLAAFYYNEECRWIKLDHLLQSSSDQQGEGSHEWHMSRQIRSELNEKIASLAINQ